MWFQQFFRQMQKDITLTIRYYQCILECMEAPCTVLARCSSLSWSPYPEDLVSEFLYWNLAYTVQS